MKKLYFPQLFTLAILLFVSAAVLAQDATLSGTVRDKKNGEPLPIVSVSVQVGEQRRGAETDFDGLYTVKVPAGTHTVTFSLVGYEVVKETVTVSAGETKTVDVSLGESSNLLETVVVTGTKFEQKLGEQTVSLEVIKSNLADRVNNTAIDQTIEKVPGVTVIDGQANIRGGSGFSYGAGSRVMLLMDDLPILTADAGFPRWSFLPVENMEQIEIIKGASSALYGSSALNGIINMRTAYPKSEPVTKFSMFSGIYQNPRNNNYYVYDKTTKAVKDTLQKAWWGNEQPHEEGFSFAHRQKFGQLDFVTGGYFFNQKSWRESEFDRRGRINLNFRYRFKNAPGLSAGINTNFQKTKSGPFLIWNDLNNLAENDSVVGGVDKGAYQLWDATPAIENRSITYSIDPFVEYFNANNNTRHKLLSRYYKNDNKTNTNQSTDSDLMYGEYQFQKRFDNAKLVLTTGVAGTYGKTDSDLFGYTVSDGDTSNIIRTASNIGVYLQADKKFFNKLNVSLGLRYESNSINSGIDSLETSTEAKPVVRIGVNYEAAKYTFIRASFGQGYRFPTIAEKFVRTDLGTVSYPLTPTLSANIPVGIFPNNNLTSETGWSAELGIKQGVQIGEWRGFVDVAGFINRYNNMMEFTFGAGSDLEAVLGIVWPEVKDLYNQGIRPTQITKGLGFQSVNIGNTNIVGIDLSFVGQGKIGTIPVNILTGYTYIDPKFQSFDQKEKVLSSISYDENGDYNEALAKNVLKYRFRHVAKVDVEATIKKVALGFSLQYNSNMEAIDEAFNKFLPGVADFRAANNKGAAIMSARLTYEMAKNASLGFIVDNLTNVEYATRPAIMDAPRSFTIRLNYNFDYDKK